MQEFFNMILKISTNFAAHPLTKFLIEQIKLAEKENFPSKYYLLATFQEFARARGDLTYLETLAFDSQGLKKVPKCVRFASLMLIALFVESGDAPNAFDKGDASLKALREFYTKNLPGEEARNLRLLCLAALARAGLDLRKCYGILDIREIAVAGQWINEGAYFDRLKVYKR